VGRKTEGYGMILEARLVSCPRHNELVVHTKDIGYDVTVDLSYAVFAEGVIRKTATVHNNTPQLMTVESAQ
jgi:hypothetical protein